MGGGREGVAGRRWEVGGLGWLGGGGWVGGWLVAGCWLLVCLLLVGCWLLVVGCCVVVEVIPRSPKFPVLLRRDRHRTSGCQIPVARRKSRFSSAYSASITFT